MPTSAQQQMMVVKAVDEVASIIDAGGCRGCESHVPAKREAHAQDESARAARAAMRAGLGRKDVRRAARLAYSAHSGQLAKARAEAERDDPILRATNRLVDLTGTRLTNRRCLMCPRLSGLDSEHHAVEVACQAFGLAAGRGLSDAKRLKIARAAYEHHRGTDWDGKHVAHRITSSAVR